MKKLLLLFTFLVIAIGLFAKLSKTVDLATAGTLSTVLTSEELNTITELTVTGNIDARDFKTMRDAMPLLAVLDLSGATVVGYTGTEGNTANVIPWYAFGSFSQLNTSLISVVLPSTVTSIGTLAFANCFGLTSVTIPQSVTSIGGSAFYKCIALSSITIPSSVTSIGESAFAYCTALALINIPASVSAIGFQAFYNCGGSHTVDEENQYYSSLDDIIFNKDKTELIVCPIYYTGDYIIPSSVTSIEGSAFSNCSRLYSVTIPSTVTDIGRNAFSGCKMLTSIYVLSPIPVDISNSIVFAGTDKTTCTLYVPVGSKSEYQFADDWKDFTHIVEKEYTGIDPIINEKQLIVYPNPTSGEVKLKFNKVPQRGIYITVLDITGKTILQQLVQEEEQWIDLKGNPTGVYFIKTDLRNQSTRKLILR